MKPIPRRLALQHAVAAGAAASLTACGPRRIERLIPWLAAPDDVVPGQEREYRTVCRQCPAGCGVTARTVDGRALKIEGNPEHPIGRGATCATGQAAVAELYSPDRLRAPLERQGQTSAPIGWERAIKEMAAAVNKARDGGLLVAILTRREIGALGDLFAGFLGALGQASNQVVTFAPNEPSWDRAGAGRAFGCDAAPVYAIERANLLLSIGADFVEFFGSPVEHARALSEMRRRTRARGGRFVYVGPRLSLTAAAADAWLSIRPGSELALVLGLCARAIDLGARGDLPDDDLARLALALRPHALDRAALATGLPAAEIDRLAQSLVSARPSLCLGPGQAVAGEDRERVAFAVHALNALCGNVGQTVRLVAPMLSGGPAGMTLDELAAAMEAGKVGALIVHHADPFGYGGAFARFEAALDKVPFVAAFGHFSSGDSLDATMRRAHFALPDLHPLQAWGQVAPRPGVTGLQQPVMAPLDDVRAAADVLLAVGRASGAGDQLPKGDFATVVRKGHASGDFERGGVFAEAEPLAVKLDVDALVAAATSSPPTTAPPTTAPPAPSGDQGDPLLVLFPSPRHLDARPGVSPLLEEIPDPLAGISWGGWLEVHPERAARLGVESGDIVRVARGELAVELPALVGPGVRPDTVAAPMPYALPLARAERGALLGAAGPVSLRKTGRRLAFEHRAGWTRPADELARTVPAASPAVPKEPKRPSLVGEHRHGRRFGLAIDLDACTGCSACVAACYVENNVPVVGAQDCRDGRIMSWLRLDAFAVGRPEKRAVLVPVMCQHCCNAPCEAVCPVYATYHQAEGVNAQIYNRCIGTRYCENNCPYKVRRFNWRDHPHPEPSELGLNPAVTVRERGVTEKCTLCFQRIRQAEERAKLEGRALRDGEVTSACAQVCPTQAIVFGDLRDPNARAHELANDPRAYRLLSDLNTEPGVHYLARIIEDRS